MAALRGPVATGSRFGRLVVVEDCGCRKVVCKCDCGRVFAYERAAISCGKASSCGCFQVQAAGNRLRTHGKRHSREYASWLAMRARCRDPLNIKYRLYGGRGIEVCRRWVNDFAAFLADMGNRPPGHTLDRIDGDGDYEPGNCRWATPKQQAANRRPLHQSRDTAGRYAGVSP